MSKLLFDTLKLLFSGGMIDDISDFLTMVLNGLKDVMTAEKITAMMGVFTAVAASLLTVYLYIHITEKVSQEMLSLEQLILILVRYFIAMIILIYLANIITTLFDLAIGLYDVAKGWVSNSASFADLRLFPNDGNPNPSEWPKFDDVKTAMSEAGWKNTATNIGKHFSVFLYCILITLIAQVSKLAAYFIALGNAISLIARTAFSPLGVVQLFNDGQRSAGIRYLKKLLAEALSFAAILGILYAVGLLQSHVLAAQVDPVLGGVLEVENMGKIFNIKVFGSICAIQLSTVGAMFKASQLANDIVGVN